ncbi:MAG: ABC transporter ATP-binding protein [Candidatus Rokubacteria bacterium]|nr:ABC transporter ATP-binding protein [Candidatus Rokubacteria bacterium]
MGRAPLVRPKVQLKNVSKVFRDARTGQETVALKDVSLTIDAGEIVSLLGPSGCGKTTILNVIAGFERPSAGAALVDGQPVERPGADRGVVFQEPSLFHWLTVEENIGFGPRMQGRSRAEYGSLVTDLVRRVGLTSFERHLPEELSGGMKQRVSIARVLINRPEVLLLDEPFAALDAQTRLIMQEWLLDVWQDQRMAALFITHDIDEAIFLADRCYVMGVKPGHIKLELKIHIARPRSRQVLTSREFNATKAEVMDVISQESTKAFAGEPNDANAHER